MPALVGATSVAMLLHFGPYLNQSIAAEAAPTGLPDRITRVGADPAALPRGIPEAAERRYTRAARETYLAAVAVKAAKQNGRRSAMKVGEPASSWRRFSVCFGWPAPAGVLENNPLLKDRVGATSVAMLWHFSLFPGKSIATEVAPTCEPAWQSRSRPQHVPRASCHAGLAGSFFPWVFRVNAKPQPDLQPFALSVGV